MLWFLVGYSLAFFLLIFLSAAIVAGPLDAARRAAVVILAVCSFVTILGSLGPSAAMPGLWGGAREGGFWGGGVVG